MRLRFGGGGGVLGFVFLFFFLPSVLVCGFTDSFFLCVVGVSVQSCFGARG